jgi:hypothetical protein
MSTLRFHDCKDFRFFGLLLTLVVTGSALAQVGVRTSSNRDTTGRATTHSNHGWKASELIGLNVYTTGDEEKGEIEDLLIGPDGNIKYAAVSFGGFLGIGDKLFAVPMDAIQLQRKDGEANFARINVTEESIKGRHGFDQDHWPAEADNGFMTGLRTGRAVR